MPSSTLELLICSMVVVASCHNLDHAPVESRDPAVAIAALQNRAIPNAPNGYTPEGSDCPSNRPTVRSANTLSINESSWLDSRRNVTIPATQTLLKNINITDFDSDAFFNAHIGNASNLPNIGLAVSGGGYRALMNGAGALQAFDSREDNSTAQGHLGGLLQSATYLSGLSGGGWLVGSLFMNNFTTITALLNDKSGTVWEFGNSIFEGPATGSVQVFDTAQYYNQIYNAVDGKSNAGFNPSITDYWGRALSYQLINASDGGVAYTFSSIALDSDFSSGQQPMPVLVSDGRAPNQQIVSLNATVYEFNPWEFGTWDPTTYGFVPIQYLGSNFSAGVLPDDQKCVRGFDNAGYVMGTSSTLFNQFLLEINTTSISNAFKSVLTKILTTVGENNNDIADFTPNPFYHWNNATSRNAQTKNLTLVDGGEDLQNIPLHPLIQPARHVDVIFAVDSSADTTTFWPNGTSMVASYERSINKTGIGNGTAFPSIPDVNTFVNLGLNMRPTFFGCNSSNITGPSPLIVYLPNSPYVYDSNVSTFTPSTNNSVRNAIVANGNAVATMGNSTADKKWSICAGCAIMSRSWERTSTAIPEVCNQCFSKYCWDGSLNSTVPGTYEPKMIFPASKVGSTGITWTMNPMVLGAAIFIVLFFTV